MLRTLSQERPAPVTIRLAGIGLFTLVTIVSARITIEVGGPVPFTLQPLAVLLAGMLLGAKDGATSQLAYVALIALNLPFDARGLGAAAFFGPTGGYLVGFIMAAWVAGALTEASADRPRLKWLAGAAAILVIYAFGVIWLRVYTGWLYGLSWEYAIQEGALKFMGYDLIKAVIATGLYTYAAPRLPFERNR